MEEDVRVFDIDFGDNGNWEEVATSIPLFISMVVNGIAKTIVTEGDVEKLQGYSGRMTYDFNTDAVVFELIKKEVVEEVTVEKSN